MSQSAQASEDDGAESSAVLSHAHAPPASDNCTKFITWVPPLEIVETDDLIMLVAYSQLPMRHLSLSTCNSVDFSPDGTACGQALSITMTVTNTLIKRWDQQTGTWQCAGQGRTNFAETSAKFTIRMPECVDVNSRLLRYNKHGFIIYIYKSRGAKLCSEDVNIQMEVG